MKQVITLFTVTFLSLSFNANAQEYQTEKELIESVLGQVKKDFVTETVTIPTENNDVFWEIYNDYEVTRKELSREKIKLANNYALFQDESSQKLDKAFMNKVFKLQRQSEKNIKKYYNKLERKTSTATAMQFFQVEQYLNTGVNNLLYENLPLKAHVM